MSATSYADVNYEGGPLGGNHRRYEGEPAATLTHHGGHYVYRQGSVDRTGSYTWEADVSDDPVVPQDGDHASALLEQGGEPVIEPGADRPAVSTTTTHDGPAPEDKPKTSAPARKGLTSKS